MSRWFAWYPPAHIPSRPKLRVIITTPRILLHPTKPSMTRNSPANRKPAMKLTHQFQWILSLCTSSPFWSSNLFISYQGCCKTSPWCSSMIQGFNSKSVRQSSFDQKSFFEVGKGSKFTFCFGPRVVLILVKWAAYSSLKWLSGNAHQVCWTAFWQCLFSRCVLLWLCPPPNQLHFLISIAPDMVSLLSHHSGSKWHFGLLFFVAISDLID